MDKEKTLIIAGHSLGSGIAEYCASFMSDDVLAIGFNGGPVGHICKNKNSNNIINIIAKHDILNRICKLIPVNLYMKHIGKIKIINDKYKFPSIKAHCNFEAFMNYKFGDIINE